MVDAEYRHKLRKMGTMKKYVIKISSILRKKKDMKRRNRNKLVVAQ